MTLNIEQIKKEYDDRQVKLNFLIEEIKFSLLQELNRNKIKIHSLIHRIKSIDSFLGKIRRKDIKEPFNEIHDLAGVRIICLFLPDLQQIGSIIQNQFDVFEEDNKVDGGNEDIFGYMSLHYKAKLRNRVTVPAFEEINDYTFEIQVRTIAQDAWASISHYLDYKQESFLPTNLRRDFYALSGLFYVADTHFTILRKEQSEFYIEKNLQGKNDGTTKG